MIVFCAWKCLHKQVGVQQRGCSRHYRAVSADFAPGNFWDLNQNTAAVCDVEVSIIMDVALQLFSAQYVHFSVKSDFCLSSLNAALTTSVCVRKCGCINRIRPWILNYTAMFCFLSLQTFFFTHAGKCFQMVYVVVVPLSLKELVEFLLVVCLPMVHYIMV